MKTPKILPWLARKAGITDERAELLWHEAILYATQKTDWVNSPEYWRLAEQRLLELVEADSICRPQLVPMLRTQHRLGDLSFLALENMMKAANEAWHQFQRYAIH